jgi:hypothetical protein|eukprot:968918-Prymnesium_polylepis.1
MADFADISRETTNYILITECIPFPPRDRMGEAFAPLAILPKLGKFQDMLLPNAADYYFALVRTMARLGAADKRGEFDFFLGEYAWSKGPTMPDSPQVRDMCSAGVGGML